jgi:hypothetical protein
MKEKNEMLEPLKPWRIFALVFSLLEAQSYDAASHSSLRQRFGLYPMGDGARIRCAVGAVLPRAGMSAAKSQEKTKRIKSNSALLLAQRPTHF